jgi:phosphate-selective porin OprO and OprP
MRTTRVLALAALLRLPAIRVAHGDDKPEAKDAQEKQEARQVTAQEEPEESDFSAPPARIQIKDWNEYDFKYLTFKWGIYTILDFGNAAQTDASKALIEVPRDYKIRDFRFTFSGKLKTERKITYTMGLMYDGPTNSWFPRETGIQVAIPELWGNIFVGRQKEGISLSKISVGYAGWMMERMPMNDAAIPIMADGIKWLGVHPSGHANWNIAYFINKLPKSPSKDWYDQALVARFAWVPLKPGKDEQGSLLHLGAAYHWGEFSNEEAQLKSRPESSTAPFFLDTGVFPAKTNNMLGLEAYYRYNNWLLGSEAIFDFIRSSETGNPLLWGGEAFVSWAVTGEIRPYIDIGGKIGFLQPKTSAFEGGTGALEAVLHASYTDLDDEGVAGGRFWRITPQLNWYLDDRISFRINYGLGHLDNVNGSAFTNFFQFRLQLQIE